MKTVSYEWGAPCFLALEWIAIPGRIICFSQHGIKCLDQKSGAEIWSDHRDYGGGVAVTRQGTLLASCRPGPFKSLPANQTRAEGIVELDAATGHAIRLIATQLAPAAVTDHGILCRWLEMGGRFRTRIALIDETGELVWCEERAGEDRFQWTCPVAKESVLASYGKVVECRSVESGSLLWSQSMAGYGGIGRPWGATLSDGVLVLLVETGTVALDVEDGHVLWFHPSVARATLSNGQCFLSGHRSVTVMDARSGDPVWSQDVFAEMRKTRRKGALFPLATAPAVSPGFLFVADQSGRVWVLDGRTGQLLDTVRPREIGAISGSPLLVVGDRLYLNDISMSLEAPSVLHCFRVHPRPLRDGTDGGTTELESEASNGA